MRSSLSGFQARVLRALAGATSGWVLSGGGALAAFVLGHRTTRDLDLFWHGRATLDRQPEECVAALRAAGLTVDLIQRSPGFARLDVRDGPDAVVVDLVAEPVARIEAPVQATLAGTVITHDSAREILANKLGTLLHRAELRDLVDVEALLGLGLDLEQAMADAAKKDGGFSPMTLGWALAQFPVAAQAKATGLAPERVVALESFRDELARRVARLARP